MDVSAQLRDLARLLETRKQLPARPYHLLLTSTLSLTPDRLKIICGTDSWPPFRAFLQQLSPSDRLRLLAVALSSPEHRAGYRALANLIAGGYFATILTTNIDSGLDDALFEAQVHISPILVAGRDTGEHIVQALDDTTHAPRILKLQGSLRDGVIADQFPDFFELNHEISRSVRAHLNRDILIVGSLEHERALERNLSWERKSSVYAVPLHEIARDDALCQLIRERGQSPEQRVFTDPPYTVDLFFSHLARQVSGNTAQPLPPAEPGASETPTASSREDDRSPASSEHHRAVILLVTVTEVETSAVFTVLKRIYQRTYVRHVIGDKTYYALGVINEARIFLVQSEMGAGGPGGSLLTINEGIRALAPSAVIMVGIAFGFHQDTQRIGDILVSQQLRAYEPQRLGQRLGGASLPVALRGDLASASVRLLDRFRSGYKDWRGRARVTFGLILSGEKLIDNKHFRNALLSLEPEAVGGEMEGAGLYAVAQRHKVDWILVKAICDWADGNKGQQKLLHQQKAARYAALFTLHVLQQTKLYE